MSANVFRKLRAGIYDCADDFMQKMVNEIEMQLTIAKMKSNNTALAKWNIVKNSKVVLNKVITEIVINLEQKDLSGSKISGRFRGANRNLNWNDKNSSCIQFLKPGLRFGKCSDQRAIRKNIYSLMGKPEKNNGKPYAFLELSLRQAEDNIIQIINNHKPSL